VHQLRVDAFKAWRAEVGSGAFPEPKHLLEVPDEEYQAFLDGLG
jgi:hypothetical protein